MVSSQQRTMNLPGVSTVNNVEDHQFEPIKGYPMLHWKGKRPFRSTQYYPAQLKEIHGEAIEGWRNKIYWGDNLQVMSHLLKEFRGKVNLVYIDPPFDSKADYKKKVELQGRAVTNDQTTFEEKQYADIWSNDEYLQFMYERLILVRELLADNGSIYVHCDYRKSHHLRCILDEIFGAVNLANEIVWAYTRPSRVTDYFPRVHDSILFYSKTQERVFNTENIRTPYDEETLARSNRVAGSESVMGAKEGANRLREGGKVPEDYWEIPTDDLDDNFWKLPILQGNALERENYPTQKPAKLLERIIYTSTNPGDVVFDCFMGSGTTQAVATKLGRRFIGADINLGAVQITTKRLLGITVDLEQHHQQGKLKTDAEAPITHYTGFEVYNVNHYDLFRNPLHARDILLEALEIQPLERNHLFDGIKDDRMVKIMPVNRIATRADLTELTTGFDYKAFERKQKDSPTKPVEKILLVCMGHEPDLAAILEKEAQPFKIDVEVVDILRDKSNLEFKRDSEAQIKVQGKHLVVEKFYPMNLLQKLSLQQENVEDWRELVESIMIDWNYDGAILEPKHVDIPDKNDLVKGRYEIPKDAGTIRVKITDLLSESLEVEVQHG